MGRKSAVLLIHWHLNHTPVLPGGHKDRIPRIAWVSQPCAFQHGDRVKHSVTSQTPSSKFPVQGRRVCVENHQFPPMVCSQGHIMLLGMFESVTKLCPPEDLTRCHSLTGSLGIELPGKSAGGPPGGYPGPKLCFPDTASTHPSVKNSGKGQVRWASSMGGQWPRGWPGRRPCCTCRFCCIAWLTPAT